MNGSSQPIGTRLNTYYQNLKLIIKDKDKIISSNSLESSYRISGGGGISSRSPNPPKISLNIGRQT
jgi:hypothetical protein